MPEIAAEFSLSHLCAQHRWKSCRKSNAVSAPRALTTEPHAKFHCPCLGAPNRAQFRTQPTRQWSDCSSGNSKSTADDAKHNERNTRKKAWRAEEDDGDVQIGWVRRSNAENMRKKFSKRNRRTAPSKPFTRNLVEQSKTIFTSGLIGCGIGVVFVCQNVVIDLVRWFPWR